MSVLIKGMEMPNNCGECQFCHTENFTQWCCPTGRKDVFYDAIPEWCPLEEPKTEMVDKSRIRHIRVGTERGCRMTKTEAIAELSVLHERLSNPKDCEDGCYSWEDGWYVEAIDMAIELLQKNIERQEMIIKASERYLGLVRCKDCKHLYKDGECPLRTWLTHTEEDFCSYGERRKDSE